MKFYEYVDETGQDTEGKLFIVTVLVLAAQRYELEKALESIEIESGKRKKKWTNTKYAERESYVRKVMKLEGLRKSVFFDVLKDSKNYFDFTAKVAAQAVYRKVKKSDEVTVYVDGFTRGEVAKFKRIIKPSIKARTFVKVLRRDESSSLLRLADAFCGLLRDAEEGEEWARKLVQLVRKKRLI